MNARLERTLWIVAAATTVAFGVIARARTAQPSAGEWPLPTAVASLSAVRPDLGDLVRQVVASDPFRLERRPADIPFGSAVAAEMPAIRPIMVAPVVSGIVGPPWRAVLEGVPGREGSVLVSVGDTLGGYRITSVRQDSIVIQAKDTTWRLAVRRTW